MSTRRIATPSFSLSSTTWEAAVAVVAVLVAAVLVAAVLVAAVSVAAVGCLCMSAGHG